jgi:DNA-binding CsgD family transcriptional regulator
MARKTVGDADLHTMLRVVNAPDDAADGEPLPPSVLVALSQLLRADAVYFIRLDVERREAPLHQRYGQTGGPEDDATLEHVFWRNYWTSPSCSYPDRTGDVTSVTKRSDFTSMAALRRTEMWANYLKPAGSHREMMACLPSPPRRTLRLLVVRGPGPDFSERDRGLLALLRPHLDARFREWERRRQPVTLTPRQRELLALVAAGRTNRQIARHLGISEGTARTHLQHIFDRLQVTSRTAAVVRAFPHGYAGTGADETFPARRPAGNVRRK